jgi:AraC family transcriptional regulator
MEIAIEQLPPMRVGAVRHVGPFNQIGAAFQRLGSLAGPAGLFQAPGAVMLAVFHDDPRVTPAEQLRSDAAIVVGEGTRLPEGLTEQMLSGGRYARGTHVGSYEGLRTAWPQFMESLGAGGHRPRTGPAFEVYRNDMRTTPEAELRTDLYMPIE